MSPATYRDNNGKELTAYPRPSVAVDTAVLTVAPEAGLMVLQVRRHNGSGWALPGTFLHEGEVLADAVTRSLLDKANVVGLEPRQLHVFDALDRDDRGWVLSVAHIAVARLTHLADRLPTSTRLKPVGSPGRLPFDHPSIIERAVDELQLRYTEKPDPDRLLEDEFTLRELRLVHEAIAGHPLQRDTFRRAMEAHLTATGTTTSGTRGRPAELFRRW
ncbi:NUDIX domain-containing protein [Mycobacterium sp. OTB74]|jgi:ADP-ribose pyrophosphatase YjhB (NUDIX family)|uniref:NUDIX hydrolase n=1 Tax=Mycobacterium sp. OTB74 TaxID=1853452 RepID=UPI002473FB0D|nr:NUDIX domain-containing protein [Mycobacterium sp. OTB74]MDH6244322.1 8-oxo-dGTP diphosphatase [Mycobacterium sp. OTB74]